MRSPAVVEVDPVANYAACVLQRLESMTVDALLLERPDYELHHAVLLRTVRGDEFLSQAVATHQARVVAAREDQAVIRSQQERLRHAAQRAESADQGLL